MGVQSPSTLPTLSVILEYEDGIVENTSENHSNTWDCVQYLIITLILKKHSFKSNH